MPIEVVRRMRSCAKESNILFVFFHTFLLAQESIAKNALGEEKFRFSPSPRPHSLKTAEISTADLGLSALSFQHLVKFVCFFDCSNNGFLLAKILSPTP